LPHHKTQLLKSTHANHAGFPPIYLVAFALRIIGRCSIIRAAGRLTETSLSPRKPGFPPVYFIAFALRTIGRCCIIRAAGLTETCAHPD